MEERQISRRDVVKMAKVGTLLTVGMGLSQFVHAENEETVLADSLELEDGAITIPQSLANRLKALGVKNGGYGVIIFQLNDVIISSSHALPLDGDFAAAKSNRNAKISVKVSGKDDKAGPQASGRLGNFEIQD